MKAEEFIDEGKKDRKDKRHTIKPKTPNPVAKHAMSTIGGGGFGAHKDKKKAAKQGDVKHKNKNVTEYGDTAKGQKMLTKVQKRAVDRVTSKKADTDPKYAKKNQDTANAAWERMKDKDVVEAYPGHIQKGKELDAATQKIQKNLDKRIKKVDNKDKKGVAEGDVFEYETHTYKDSQGNVWRVNDEGEKELVSAAPGGGYGGGSRYGSRYPRRPAYNKPKGYYFYNVPPDKENEARAAGLRQSKSGKWFDTMTNSAAEKVFGKGRYWEPKN